MGHQGKNFKDGIKEGLDGKNFDRLLLGLSFSGAVLFSAALWCNDWLVSHFFAFQVTSGESIGEVLATKNDVRRRVTRSLTWLQTGKNEKLYERDTIFTGNESEMSIRIGGENKLTLRENSLVVLQTRGNEILFDLQLGSLSTSVASGRPIKMLYEGQVAEIKSEVAGAPLYVSRNKTGVLNVMSQSGSVEVSIGKSQTKIKKDEQFNIEKNLNTSKQEFSAHFTSHQLHEKVRVVPEDVVRFEWVESDPTIQNRIQISKSNQFFKSKLVVNALAPDKKFEWSHLPEGVYFYRVVDDSTSVSRSVVQSLEVRLSEPTQLVQPKLVEAPKVSEVLEIPPERFHGPERPTSNFNPEEPPVASRTKNSIQMKFADQINVRSPASIEKNLINPPEFRWVPKVGSESYEIQIDQTNKFQTPIVFGGLKEAHYTWRGATPGLHYWRVKAKNSEGLESQPSEVQELLVQLSAPVLKADELKNEKVFDAAEAKNTKDARLSWEPLPFAKSYSVIVDGKTRMINSEQISLPVAPNVETKIKVAAANLKGQPLGAYAEHTFKFKTELLLKTPEILLPSDNTTIVAFSKDKIDPIVFAWKSESGSKQFQLQFSGDSNFSKILAEKEIKDSKFVLKEKLSNTVVYWRVRAFEEKSVSEWSKPRSYEMQTMSERD